MKTLFKGILIPAFLSLITILINCQLSFAQGGPGLDNSGPMVADIIPPSPEAAALGKYGAVPVSQYTGIPNISIPLYNLQYKDISLPIGLSYHAGGFQVSEEASRIGLGWTLNAGGLISRNVRGSRDEELGQGYAQLHSQGYTIECSNRALVEAAAGVNGMDAQPDQFSINFLGISGRFVFTPRGEIKMLSCNSLLELEPTVSAGNIISWTVKDANGFTYTFAEYERTKYESVTHTNGISTSSWEEWANTSWFLTEIRSPLNDVVSFEYAENTAGVNTNEVSITESSYHKKPNGQGTPECPNTRYKTRGSTVMMRWVRLVKISSKLTEIEFLGGITRQDIPWISSVGRVLIKDKKSGKSIKAIDFGQSHFQATGCDTPYDCYRLKLDQLTMKGFDAQQQEKAGETYYFTYNSTQLPAKSSLEQDHWGFYNANGQDAAQNPTLLPEMVLMNNFLSGADREPNASKMGACMLESIQYPTGGISEFTFEPNTYSRSGGQAFAPKIGGGMRIKRIRNISGFGNPDEITEYAYIDQNDPNLSSGKINSPIEYTYDRKTFTEFNGANASVVRYECSYIVRESSSHIPIMRTGGSIIGYNRVEERKISNSNPNGKIVSYFFSPHDFPDYYRKIDQDNYEKFALVLNNEWKRGMMNKQEIFDESDFLVQKTEYDYSPLVCDTVKGLNSSIFKARILTGPGIQDEFFCHTFEERIGWMRLNKVTTTHFTSGNALSFVKTETNYTYNDKGQSRSTFMVNSNGNLHTTEAYYPGEDDPDNPGSKLGIPEMWDQTHPHYKHMLTPVIVNRTLVNGVVQAESKVDFLYDATLDQVKLNQYQNFPTAGISNPLTTQYFYDEEGVLTGSQQTSGPITSIIRVREKAFPAAKVINAAYEDVAYSSFDLGVEKDADNGYRRIEGRWEFMYTNDPVGPNNSGGGWSSQGAKTGIGQFDLTTIRELHTRVSTGGTYTLSFWAKKNNPINISTAANLLLSETANDGWTLYIYELNLNPGQNLVLKGNYAGGNYIDELRLHPKDAQMTTICYDVKMRAHTMTDVNNRSVKYSYDAFGRLIQLRDHNGNLLSENEYFYYNQ
ncbi:MAG: RHS repeat domain-containing protein [Bacteroidota bacterium]